MTKLDIKTESVWKLALTLLGWLVMGIWLFAKISAGQEAIQRDIAGLKTEIQHLTNRLDNHIDQTRRNTVIHEREKPNDK